MALPTIDVPTFDVEIPTKKEKIKFRPFLVKEDKLLTIANNGTLEEMITACQQVLVNCSLGKYDAFEAPLFELQWVFLQVKANSVGNMQEFKLKCGTCETLTNYELDILTMEIKNQERVNDNKIKLNDDTMIIAKFPSSSELATTEDEDVKLIKSTIEAVYQAGDKYTFENEPEEEVTRFIESLPLNALKKLEEFYTNAPYIEHVVEYKCKGCDTENVVSINGYENFFV